SGVTPEVEESLYQLGDLLGVAYQIYDDCLDMVGDEDDAGKTLHTDATKGKLTLPIFNLLECGDRNVEATLRDAIENREVVDYSAFQDNPV
ncbi:polyprenyl synthetase family protein, partial [[Eubacterium] rectale]|nr:polyprenyl synthetase family protein [Agathobacter rectalis]